MQEAIIEALKFGGKALTASEIFHMLNMNTTEELKDILKELDKMEEELKVTITKKGKYMLFENSNLKVGKFIANKKGFGFVDTNEEEDIFISAENINGAIHGDTVVVEVISKNNTDIEGKIIRITKRDLEPMVGEYTIKNGIGSIILDEDKIKLDIQISEEDSMSAMEGHKVLVKPVKKIKDNIYKGEIIKILGHKNDPGVDILSITAKHRINDEFSEEVMEEVERIPSKVLDNEYQGRIDLRNSNIFTIDGDDTKDIDDAISIEKLQNGNYKLGVHIADVSYYVKEGTKLDDEAYERGTSVYLADRVIPMIPHKLSNGICSLNPNVDRLAMSCVMEIDHKGDVVDYEIFESVIASRIQMTYKNVNKVLEDNIIPDTYKDYSDSLYLMKELAQILRNNKIKKGYIDFDLDEAKLIVDDKGTILDVVLRERGIGERLIEDFMIAANETVATHIYFMELPFVYRVHGIPDEEKIRSFLHFISILGYKIDGKIKDITPKTMQSILEQLKDKKEFHILSNLLLRSMQKAVYDKVNIGHFGLASKYYTHFTSPIRRYPDTTVHRLLRKYLFESNMSHGTIDYWDKKLVFLTEHSSMKERSAIECEREVMDMKMAEYMEGHVGERFTGIVNTVVNFGMFIELPNLIEGLIKVEDLTDDRYIYDEDTFSLIGVNKKGIYRLGDTVDVIVKSASKLSRTIDFIIAPPLEK